jgi:hypothetical protein
MRQGVTQDYVRAQMWFNLGAASGDVGGVKSRDTVAARMTPQQNHRSAKDGAGLSAAQFQGLRLRMALPLL